MTAIMAGSADTHEISDFLVALADRGETVEEIVAAVSVMRGMGVRVEVSRDIVLDTCGTGGDRKNTFNISTIAAFIVSACGVTVAKHGNRSVSSRCGSADVLEAAGVRLSLSLEKVSQCLNEAGIAFLYAPDFHPAMKYAAAARKQLGRRTIFNIMGPLCNPAGATHQLVGVFADSLLPVVVNVLGALGAKRAVAIHSADGLDEISTTDVTRICEWSDGKVLEYTLSPESFGLKRVPLEALMSSGLEENLRIFFEVLKGGEGLRRDIVLLNAAGALYAADRVPSIKEGLELAREAVDTGRAFARFELLKKISQS
jgi:anthranilate phosphoribosyltransferase